MSWEKEQVLILVKATPNWSIKYKEYEICTAGITENKEWRRLYPFPESWMLRKDVHVWDRIEIETTKPKGDPRPESRIIKVESIKKIDHIKERKERRSILEQITEQSLDIPINEKRTMTLVKPRIDAFNIRKKTAEIVQITLNGKPFKRSPYGDFNLYYKWRCPRRCQVCKERPHTMECFDWGANVLYKRYKDEEQAKKKVKQMCYYRMKYDYDTWFALGTHSRRPWKVWMIVGLLWMKRKVKA